MSEFIADARVLVVPDTTKFRAQLLAQLAAATKGLKVPIPVSATSAASISLSKNFSQVATSANLAATGIKNKTAAEKEGVASAKRSADATKAQAQRLEQLNKAAIANTAGLLGLRGAVLTAGVAFIGATIGIQAFIKSVQSFADFEASLNTFRVVAGATAEEMEAVSAAALRLGADVRLPAVTASDAAVAMLELAKAGLTAEEAIAGAEGVLQLATAAQISQAEAAELTANALNSFGLAGADAVDVADALANAANAAQGSITDFGLALRQVAAVSNQVGINLQDTTALLTLLARNGLRGSDAGTSLRVALLRLINPTGQANALLRDLNINIRDLSGNVRADVFAQFGESVRDLTPTLQDATAATIFGADAIRAVAIAGEEGAAGLRLARFEIDQQGTAAEVAAARNEGLAGSISALSSGAQTAGTSIGGLIAPVLNDFINTLTKVVTGLNKAVVGLKDFAEQAADTETPVGRLGDRLRDLAGIVDLLGGRRAVGFLLEESIFGPEGPTETEKQIEALTDDLINLQKARVQAQKGETPIVADLLTKEIKFLHEQIQQLKIEAGIIIPPQTEGQKRLAVLSRAIERLRKQAEENFEKGFVDIDLDAAIDRLNAKLITVAKTVGQGLEKESSTTFRRTADNMSKALDRFSADPLGEFADEALKNLRRFVDRAGELTPKAGAIGPKLVQGLRESFQKAIVAALEAGRLPAANALKRLYDQLAADAQININDAFGKITVPLLGDEIAKALQPSGVSVAREAARGTQGGQIDALEGRLAEVRELIASGRASGAELEDLFIEEKSINDQIDSILNDIASEAEDAQKSRFSRFQERLAAALRPTERLLIRAAANERLGDDIKFREQLIGILRDQIALIKKTLGNTKEARALIRDIQDRIIDEVLKLKKDRADFRRDLRDALEERLERIQRGTELDIELADINENTKRRVNLRLRLIAQLKKEAKVLHLQGNALKENRNERARIRAEIDAILKEGAEDKDKGKTAQQFFFEQLQAQQGFASNLLGNLITGPTAGLVGVPAPSTPSRGVAQAAQVAEGKRGGGPTSGQAQTTNDILIRILAQLKELNGDQKNPEAKRQRNKQHAVMDYDGAGFGGL